MELRFHKSLRKTPKKQKSGGQLCVRPFRCKANPEHPANFYSATAAAGAIQGLDSKTVTLYGAGTQS